MTVAIIYVSFWDKLDLDSALHFYIPCVKFTIEVNMFWVKKNYRIITLSKNLPTKIYLPTLAKKHSIA